MSDVLISFVVPAFNEETLIQSCLYAILAEISRSQCRAEIIVVNNNSTDSTRLIASSVPGVIVVDEAQRGLVQARKAGCLVARGKLIANIDADRMLPPGWLQVALAEFERSPGLVALSGPFIHYDMSRWVRLVAAGFYRIAFAASFLVGFVTGTEAMMQGGNFIVSKRALEATDAFNPDFRFYGEDTELARRLSRVGRVKFSFVLPAYSSGRRLAGEGLVRVGLRYAANYMSTILFKHPFSSSWQDFRHATGDTGNRAAARVVPLQAKSPSQAAEKVAI
jgi:glycosyltransferase involved in cell wall biosynthesis